jgi:hypothetical protein
MEKAARFFRAVRVPVGLTAEVNVPPRKTVSPTTTDAYTRPLTPQLDAGTSSAMTAASAGIAEQNPTTPRTPRSTPVQRARKRIPHFIPDDLLPYPFRRRA